jgi:hypothetical protein
MAEGRWTAEDLAILHKDCRRLSSVVETFAATQAIVFHCSRARGLQRIANIDAVPHRDNGGQKNTIYSVKMCMVQGE